MPDGITDMGACGENLEWTLSNEGVLTISGSGAMYDYDPYTQVPWYDQSTFISAIVIEPGITCIGKYAFCDCTKVTAVEIPSGVTGLGLSAGAK